MDGWIDYIYCYTCNLSAAEKVGGRFNSILFPFCIDQNHKNER